MKYPTGILDSSLLCCPITLPHPPSPPRHPYLSLSGWLARGTHTPCMSALQIFPFVSKGQVHTVSTRQPQEHAPHGLCAYARTCNYLGVGLIQKKNADKSLHTVQQRTVIFPPELIQFPAGSYATPAFKRTWTEVITNNQPDRDQQHAGRSLVSKYLLAWLLLTNLTL